MCLRSVHAADHTERHTGRVNRRQLPDTQSKRPRPASAFFWCPEPEFLLAANVPENTCTTLDAMGGKPTIGRPYGFGPARFIDLLKSMTEELGEWGGKKERRGRSELPTMYVFPDEEVKAASLPKVARGNPRKKNWRRNNNQRKRHMVR